MRRLRGFRNLPNRSWPEQRCKTARRGNWRRHHTGSAKGNEMRQNLYLIFLSFGSAWLKGTDDPVVDRINKRLHTMTNLEMETAEELQVEDEDIAKVFLHKFRLPTTALGAITIRISTLLGFDETIQQNIIFNLRKKRPGHSAIWARGIGLPPFSSTLHSQKREDSRFVFLHSHSNLPNKINFEGFHGLKNSDATKQIRRSVLV